jgi:hypothetical protein
MPAGVGEKDVDKAGSSDLDALDHTVGIEKPCLDPRGQLPWRALQWLREHECGVGCEVPVLGLLGRDHLNRTQALQLRGVDLADHPLGGLL